VRITLEMIEVARRAEFGFRQRERQLGPGRFIARLRQTPQRPGTIPDISCLSLRKIRSSIDAIKNAPRPPG
jgi:hypothetical protein